ncbi:MAG: hypothetical protein ACFFCZ_24230 [Promethearchaeota archaeon]
MTIQMLDLIQYKGEYYSLEIFDGSGLFSPSDFDIKAYPNCTACWCGYFMEYVCTSDQLNLKTMYINTNRPKTINGIRPKRLEMSPLYGRVFEYVYENLGLKSRFSGVIMLDRYFHFIHEHLGFQIPTAPRKIYIRIENGNIIIEVERELLELMKSRNLELTSLRYLHNTHCPLCGGSDILSGQHRATGQERIVCIHCENVLQ